MARLFARRRVAIGMSMRRLRRGVIVLLAGGGLAACVYTDVNHTVMPEGSGLLKHRGIQDEVSIGGGSIQSGAVRGGN